MSDMKKSKISVDTTEHDVRLVVDGEATGYFHPECKPAKAMLEIGRRLRHYDDIMAAVAGEPEPEPEREKVMDNSELKTEIARLRAALLDAYEMVLHWGQCASERDREKYGFEDDLTKLDGKIKAMEGDCAELAAKGESDRIKQMTDARLIAALKKHGIEFSSIRKNGCNYYGFDDPGAVARILEGER